MDEWTLIIGVLSVIIAGPFEWIIWDSNSHNVQHNTQLYFCESLLFWHDPECFVFLDEFSFVIFFMSQHTSYTQKGKEYEGYQLSTSMNSHHCVGQRPPTSQQPIAIKS